MIKDECDQHEYEIVDVLQVVGWDDNDLAIPCRLETWQCTKCGDCTESVEEIVDNDNEPDMMFE